MTCTTTISQFAFFSSLLDCASSEDYKRIARFSVVEITGKLVWMVDGNWKVNHFRNMNIPRQQKRGK